MTPSRSICTVVLLLLATPLSAQQSPPRVDSATAATIRQLPRFYQTPLGRRVAEVLPLITQESMLVGQSWGAGIGRQVAESLAQSGAPLPNQ